MQKEYLLTFPLILPCAVKQIIKFNSLCPKGTGEEGGEIDKKKRVDKLISALRAGRI